jgi:hypothetical protein
MTASASEFQDTRRIVTATITVATSTTVSAAVDLHGCALVGIQLPATFTGTALTFQAATTLTGTYQAVYGTGGSAVSYTVAQGRFIALDPATLRGIRFLKVVSGSAEGANRDIELVVRPIG